MNRAAVVLGAAVQVRMRIAQQVGPRLDEADQLDGAGVELARRRRRAMQPGDVHLQVADAVVVLAFGRRQHPLLGVVAKIGVGDHEVRIVLIRGNLGQVILEHAGGLAHGLDDAELAI